MGGDMIPDGAGAAGVIGASGFAIRQVGQFMRETFPKTTDAVDTAGAAVIVGAVDWAQSAAERWRSFHRAAVEAAATRGLTEQTRNAQVNVLYPLLEAALLEDDDTLRDHWAQMLVNAIDAESKAEVRRAYVSIFKDMTPLDVRNLAALYSIEPGPHGRLARTAKLPDEALPYYEGHGDPAHGLPAPHVVRSLWNLVRLGLIAHGTLATGDELLINASITALGIGLVEAITSPDK